MKALHWIGLNDRITEAPARVCVWCVRPHFLTAEDRVRRAAGALVSHCMCKAASERMLADLETHGNGAA